MPSASQLYFEGRDSLGVKDQRHRRFATRERASTSNPTSRLRQLGLSTPDPRYYLAEAFTTQLTAPEHKDVLHFLALLDGDI